MKQNKNYEVDGQLYLDMEFKGNEVFFYNNKESSKETQEEVNISFTIEDLAFISYSIDMKNIVDKKELEKAKKEHDKTMIKFFEDVLRRSNELIEKIERSFKVKN